MKNLIFAAALFAASAAQAQSSAWVGSPWYMSAAESCQVHFENRERDRNEARRNNASAFHIIEKANQKRDAECEALLSSKGMPLTRPTPAQTAQQ